MKESQVQKIMQEIELAKNMLINRGGLNPKDADLWMEINARVRARKVRKNKKWPESRILKKTRRRFAARKVLQVAKKIPFRPFGGVGMGAIEAIEAMADSIADRLRNDEL